MDVTAPISIASDPPGVLLLGQGEHPDFLDAVAVLRASARVCIAATVDHAAARLADGGIGPEVIVFAQSRPGVMRAGDVDRLRRAAPLAGAVALAGSWCEGEPRTGRPLAGVHRLYWYEFTPWWRRQLGLRAAGLSPEWARPAAEDAVDWPVERTTDAAAMPHGAVVLRTNRWDTADALADVLGSAGCATIWWPPGGRRPCVRGVAAGIWEGGQLSGREEHDLGAFCRRLGSTVPVVALLDFPRRGAVERSRAVGAAAVLGKPWSNVDLLQSLTSGERHGVADGTSAVARAA
jgi:hypothetical protein